MIWELANSINEISLTTSWKQYERNAVELLYMGTENKGINTSKTYTHLALFLKSVETCI
jgi:hypothetical protein